nr:hypothetical protein CFP56_54294 [Quercus suber]
MSSPWQIKNLQESTQSFVSSINKIKGQGQFVRRPMEEVSKELFILLPLFNTTAAMMSLEHRKTRHLEAEAEMPSTDDEEFAAWVAGSFSSTAAAAKEASTFNTTVVVSKGQEDAQAQEHRKRRLDAAAAYMDEEFAAWIADPTFPDEALSQIFSDLPPFVEVCSQSKSNPVADADIDGDIVALITALIFDPTQPDEAWSKIFRL